CENIALHRSGGGGDYGGEPGSAASTSAGDAAGRGGRGAYADDVLQSDFAAELSGRPVGTRCGSRRAGPREGFSVAGGQAGAVSRVGGCVCALARGGLVYVPLGGHGLGVQGRRGDLAISSAE